MARQQQIKDEQAQSWEKLRILFDLANDCLLVLDLNGYIIDINRTGHERLGYTKQEMLGRRISEFDSPEFAGKVPERIAELKRHHSAVFESAHIHKNGTVMPVEVNSRLIRLDGENYFISVIRDITERKEKEKHIHFLTRICSALFQTNQALVEYKTEKDLFNRICRIAVESGGMAMTWIGQMDEADGIIRPQASYGNGQQYLDSLRIPLPPDAPENSGPAAFAMRENRPVIIQDLATDPLSVSWYDKTKQYCWKSAAAFCILRNKKTYAVATFYHHEKNAFSKEIVGLLTEMTNDISYALDRLDFEEERQKAFYALADSANRYHTILQTSLDGFWIIDMEGRIIDVNEAYLQRSGYTRDEILKLRAQDLEVMDNNEPTEPHQGRYATKHRAKDGTVWSMEVSSVYMPQDDGRYFCFMHDITQRKHAEKALRASNEQLLNAQRLAMLGSWELDLVNNKLHWSDEIYRIFEIDPKKFGASYEAFLNAVHPDDRETVNNAYVESVKNNEPYEITHRLLLKDGHIKYVTERGQTYYADDGTPLRSLGTVQDITEKQRAEEELRIAAKVFDAQQAIIVTDPDTNIIRINEAFTEITGYTYEDVKGKNPRILQSSLHPKNFYQDMWDKINREGSWQGEIWDQRKTGEIYPKWLTISSVKNNKSEITHYVGSFTDITEYKQAQEKILNLAFYDQLTGLPNRRSILERLEHSLAVSARSERYGAILYLDLDHFKTINDTQGHDSGDEVLQEIANRIQATVRHEDSIARIGGDEFVVILENISKDKEQAASHARMVGSKLLEVMARPYIVRGMEFHASVSIGVTLFCHLHESVHDLLKRADMAMYEAKKAGRNTLRFYDPVMQEMLEQRTQLEYHMRHALKKNEFRLYFQRWVDQAEHTKGAEILLRWDHPQHGLITPMNFIPLAEETGLIVPIGKWVLEEACRRLKIWQEHDKTKDLKLSVNISAREFKEPDFIDNIKQLLTQTAIDPSLLVLEITESTLLENMEEFIDKMNKLREFGISFALDDFGTGYSSLSHLKRLPINELKIDQSFVKDLGVDKNDEAIVQTIIQMGKTLGMEVIAEGVETQAQREMLEHYGCHNYQGYLFGKPGPLKAFEQELK